MACNNPLKGYLKHGGGLTFSKKDGFYDKPMQVPCGQCIACRIEKSKQWAIRIQNETRMHKENCFVTLTYADEHLPNGNTLVKEDLRLFFKRLRKRLYPLKIRYFACGEYGSEEYSSRPHYHAIIFGFFPQDSQAFKRLPGGVLYNSDFLDSVWNKGFVGVNNTSFELAQYCAKYVIKKMTTEATKQKLVEKYGDKYKHVVTQEEHYKERIPEYAVMSRGGNGYDGKQLGGIGSTYYEKYKDEIWTTDTIPGGNGKNFKPPVYYLNKLKETDPSLALDIKLKRLEHFEEEDDDRLWEKEKYLHKKNGFYKQNILKKL